MEIIEIWKDVNGYEGRYMISNTGKLLSINGRFKGKKLMKPCIGKKEGYYITALRNKTKTKKDVRIHALVADHFLIRPEGNRIVVNHIDGNKLNNNVENLEFCEASENVRHAVETGLFNIKGENHPNRKLNNEIVYYIKFVNHGATDKELANTFNVSREQVRDVRLNKNWKHITSDYKSLVQ